ncbi:hypothetical protein E1A91_D02G122300v1 [Gossypium mustelinum]|uniref:Uncharacterized protein n=1 Tax=Gossypium mustelinum TaxID=34275 RepID=A0A5D2VUP9_GOSMU|nr:hypothetical protein E1A91_D02G122300v1 [Gossypium mustelinum]
MEGLQAQQKNGGVTESGNDAGAGISHNRVGQILHSVVLGTFNVGDEGEGIIPDRTRDRIMLLSLKLLSILMERLQKPYFLLYFETSRTCCSRSSSKYACQQRPFQSIGC